MEKLQYTRLKALKAFYAQNHRLPRLEEMRGLFGVKSRNTAHFTVKQLVRMGLLRQDRRGDLVPTAAFLGIPILGDIQAGWPSPAEEELQDKITVEDYLVRNKNASYIVKAKGDSMIGAGIVEDDFLIVEQGRKPKNGDIVIASVNGDFTVKRYSKDGKQVSLTPENKRYKPLIPKEGDEFSIHSVVVGVFRRYT